MNSSDRTSTSTNTPEPDGPMVECRACGAKLRGWSNGMGSYRPGKHPRPADQPNDGTNTCWGAWEIAAVVLTAPTIHLNGTSRAALKEKYRLAGIAVMDAIQALQETAPHGRDYYPQGPDALAAAEWEHQKRLARLKSVLAEIGHLVEHCA